MINCFIAIFLSLFSLSALALNEIWQKKYDLINKDIRQIESVKRKDLSLRVRLLELYSEKLNHLLEAENELILKSLDEKTAQVSQVELAKIQKVIQSTYIQMNKYSTSLEKRIKDPEILTQIYYFKGLNNYSLKKYDAFRENFLKAESYCRSKVLCYKIKTKLADYFYNNQKFTLAIKYYEQIISNTEDKWLSKSYFNLSWSYLKTDQYEKAIAFLKKAYQLSSQDYYFTIKKQLTQSILLFHAFAKKTQEGLEYIQQLKLDSFENLMKYSHFVFEHGEKKDIFIVFQEIDKMNLKIDEKFKFLSKEITIYREFKLFEKLQNKMRRSIQQILSLKNESPKPETRKELVDKVLSYNGFLQELFKNNKFINSKKIHHSYIKSNLKALLKIDPDNYIKYYFFYGETEFADRNYKRASRIYLSSLSTVRKKESSPEEARKDPYLEKTFDSLFKSLEFIPKEKTYAKESFKYFLYFYPASEKSPLVYQRLISFYIEDKNEGSAVAHIKRYHKYFPRDIQVQQKLFDAITNTLIQDQNTKPLYTIRKMVYNDFLNLRKKNLNFLNGVIAQIHFNLIDSHKDKKSLEKSIEAYDKLFDSPNSYYELKYKILLKQLQLLSTKERFLPLNTKLIFTISFVQNPEKIKYNTNFNYYLNQVCLHSSIEVCDESIEEFHDHKIQLSKANSVLEFKLALAQNQFKKAYALASTQLQKDELFQHLLLAEPFGDSSLYKRLPEQTVLLKNLLRRKYWELYYQSFDFEKLIDFCEEIEFDDLQDELLENTKKTIKVFEDLTLSFPDLPLPKKIKNEKKEEVLLPITFEDFSVFLQSFTQQFQSEFTKIDKLLSSLSADFVPLAIHKLKSLIETQRQKYSNYTPYTPDKDLKEAISSEVKKLPALFIEKHKAYQKLAQEAFLNKAKNVGSEFQQVHHPRPYKFDNQQIIFWEEL